MSIENWLFKKWYNHSVRVSTKELNDFTSLLKTMKGEEIAICFTVAVILKNELEKSQFLPYGVFDINKAPQNAGLLAELNRLARSFQKKKNLVHAGAIKIWLFSLRSLVVPELRSQGRDMWIELSRARTHVPYALDSLFEMNVIPFEIYARYGTMRDEFYFTPNGLGPSEFIEQSTAI